MKKDTWSENAKNVARDIKPLSPIKGISRKNITFVSNTRGSMEYVSVNTFSEGDIKTPFGGYKQSGSLSRDQGTEALNQYLQTKTIWISHS